MASGMRKRGPPKLLGRDAPAALFMAHELPAQGLVKYLRYLTVCYQIQLLTGQNKTLS